MIKNPNWQEADRLQAAEELNLWLPRNNSSKQPGPADFKSSTLTTQPRCHVHQQLTDRFAGWEGVGGGYFSLLL